MYLEVEITVVSLALSINRNTCARMTGAHPDKSATIKDRPGAAWRDDGDRGCVVASAGTSGGPRAPPRDTGTGKLYAAHAHWVRPARINPAASNVEA